MVTQVSDTIAANGLRVNGKIKSKNQLRRLKAKQKKAEKAGNVSPAAFNCKLHFLDVNNASG